MEALSTDMQKSITVSDPPKGGFGGAVFKGLNGGFADPAVVRPKGGFSRMRLPWPKVGYGHSIKRGFWSSGVVARKGGVRDMMSSG